MIIFWNISCWMGIMCLNLDKLRDFENSKVQSFIFFFSIFYMRAMNYISLKEEMKFKNRFTDVSVKIIIKKNLGTENFSITHETSHVLYICSSYRQMETCKLLLLDIWEVCIWNAAAAAGYMRKLMKVMPAIFCLS